MSPHPWRYADWKAPDDDGQLLIWPDDAGTLKRQTIENHCALANAHTLIQNVELRELRRRQRQSIGHPEDDRPLIATGHQAELHHPGVWVKDVLIDALAGALGGRAW